MSVFALGLNHTTAPLDLRGRFALAPQQLARQPIRMPAHRTAAWFGIVALSAIAATTFFVDGLQYSVVTFLPFLAVISIVYARMRHHVQAPSP